MWTYKQSTGEILKDDKVIGSGYSGHGPGVNAPLLDKVHNVGPIPKGQYNIGPSHDTPTKGPVVMALSPTRSGFLIHGDSRTLPGTASEGCIILSKDIREQIASSDDRLLEVVE